MSPARKRSGSRPARLPLSERVLTVRFREANIAAWLFIASLGIITRTAFFGNLSDAVVVTVVLDTIGFLLTCLVHVLIRSRVPQPFPTLKLLPLIVIGAVLGGMIQMGAAEGLRSLSFAHGEFQRAFGGRHVPLLYYTSIFLGWALGYFWLTADVSARLERVRRSEAQSAAARAELQQLKVQLDPHFLFNALNTVTAEIPERPDVALEMTRRIAGYMRYCLDHKERSVCWLCDEIDAVRSYLRIQELRFDSHLTCTVDMDPQAEHVLVPHLILQGLVENAVKHGLRPATGAPLRINVSVRLDADRLMIVVTNPGRYAPGARPAGGLGLANLRRRLQLHYPDGHDLAIMQDGDLVSVRLVLRGAICFA
ncbi:Histidine kinase [Pseudoxanthobacter soli DSM 19599]|uniref:Histidine kinase n=1 Tax=Pseudoxanthobacter soli DSM 19599 TaxID=1123029 RepID=A0A1M7ZPP4_9HYPH|nr:histidine kinase [Pseudoxanthobacter soli]SHO66873.1 Histidine kinase [Pseudoxanthobacter soli DSM 19599]